MATEAGGLPVRDTQTGRIAGQFTLTFPLDNNKHGL